MCGHTDRWRRGGGAGGYGEKIITVTPATATVTASIAQNNTGTTTVTCRWNDSGTWIRWYGGGGLDILEVERSRELHLVVQGCWWYR